MHKKSSGFTLIEILVVIAIAVAITFFAVSRPKPQDRTFKEFNTMVKATVREVHNLARMSQTTFRLVFQLDQDEAGNNIIWVEKARKLGLVYGNSSGSLKKEADKEKEDNKIPEDFEIDKKILRKPLAIPKPFRIEDIEVGHDEKKITAGLIYVYFRPEGLIEPIAIHLTTDQDQKWTLSIHPLTGRTVFKDSYVSLADLLKTK